MTVLLVTLGAAVGAPARYLVDRAVQRRFSPTLPWGTLAVNVAASLILGFVTAAVTAGGADRRVGQLVGIGLCGALSTYSTFAFENLRLVEIGRRLLAFANVAVSVAGGLGAAFAGAAIAQAIWG